MPHVIRRRFRASRGAPIPSTVLRATQIPHTIRIAALAASLAFVAVACGSDSTGGAADTTTASTPGTGTGAETTTAGSTETTTAATTGETPGLDTLTVESGFSTGLSDLGTRYNSASAVITNTSDQTACGVEVAFDLLDASGASIDSRSETIIVAAAGAAVPVVPKAIGAGKDAEAAKLDVTVVSVKSYVAGDTCEGTSAVAAGVTLTTADVSLDADLKYINATVTNQTDAAVEKATMDCALRDAAGAIVGGEQKAINDAIEAGASVDAKVRILWAPPTAATAECSATA